MFINKVTLYSNNLAEMKNFYVDLFGFELLNSNEHGFEIKTGKSILEVKRNEDNSQPFYHFAFNIPTNLFKEAKAWTRKRVDLNLEDGDDEVHFENFDANAMYFNDPSGNIVEFIARHQVSGKSDTDTFSAESVLEISEINLTTDEVRSFAEKLIQFGIPSRNNETVEPDSLNFMGELQDGVFLLLGPPKRRWFFSDKNAETHPVTVQVNGYKTITLEDGELRLEKRK